MPNSKEDGVVRSLFRMPRFGPALFATLVVGVMMLFLNELGDNIKEYMIPSIVIYALGAALLGSIHRLLGASYVEKGDFNNEKSIPCPWKVVLLIAHLSWFGLLIWYNFWRGAL